MPGGLKVSNDWKTFPLELRKGETQGEIVDSVEGSKKIESNQQLVNLFKIPFLLIAEQTPFGSIVIEKLFIETHRSKL